MCSRELEDINVNAHTFFNLIYVVYIHLRSQDIGPVCLLTRCDKTGQQISTIYRRMFH